MGIRLILAVGVAAAFLVPNAAAADAGTLTVKRSSYGSVLFDGRGYVLYGFTADRGGRSVCTGKCLAAWPPLIVKAAGPRAGTGVKQTLLGTIHRTDGRTQATYAGHPLYYYVGDKAGQILCQNVFEYGGLWLIVRPNGTLLR